MNDEKNHGAAEAKVEAAPHAAPAPVAAPATEAGYVALRTRMVQWGEDKYDLVEGEDAPVPPGQGEAWAEQGWVELAGE